MSIGEACFTGHSAPPPHAGIPCYVCITDKNGDNMAEILVQNLWQHFYRLVHVMEQILFIYILRNKLATLDQENFILVGDLNIYLDPKQDKLDTMSNKSDQPQYRKEILSIMESFSVADFWRILNHKTRRYTWHALGKSSRLDYWLISEHF
jgi:exonuclease III